MIIVDTALQKRRGAEGKPIRVGIVGAGFMARASPTRSSTAFPACGWRRSPTARSSARVDVYEYAEPRGRRRSADTQSAARRRDPRGKPVVTEDALLLVALGAHRRDLST